MRFCGQCGEALLEPCPRCGAANPPGFKFCGQCGAPLAAAMTNTAATTPPRPSLPATTPTLEQQFTRFQNDLPALFREQLLTEVEGETRLLTILFADLSGSVAARAPLHPEDVAALVNEVLKAMVDAVMRYEGRIARLVGDAVLAFFGAPRAHENDPERAVRAALAIREAAQGLSLQVTAGLNTGEVFLGAMGSEQHREVTAMGPAINLAARLQGKAQPGQVLIGEATYRHIRGAFECLPRSLELKGLDQPVTAYEVVRPLPHPEKVRGIEGLRAELIGREDELAKLETALGEVRQGRGQMVSIIGEAGVGKSRLVGELRALAGASPESGGPDSGGAELGTGNQELGPPVWLEGRCLDVGMVVSYWPFLDMLQGLLGWRPGDDDRERVGRIVATLQALVARGSLTPERVEEVGPVLGNLLSVRFGSAWDERLREAGPEQVKQQTFLAIRDFLLALAKVQPVVLVLEDLHWADSLSLDLVSLLMEGLTLVPLLLVCVYRPEQEHKCSHLTTIAARKCAERYTELRLRELSPPQSRRLVDSLLRIEDLPATAKELILAKAQGNPFFVEEVVRSLIDAGVLYRDDPASGGDAGVWRARPGVETVSVPESVQAVILSRVDRLAQDVKQVLQAALVVGRLFRRRLLERLTRQGTELDRALWELEERQLVYQERAIPEEEYSFQHALTRETVYGNILRRRRAAFHRDVAEALEALYRDSLEEYYEQLAHHYDQAGAGEQAVEYLLKAGQKAARAYLNDQAIDHFERGLARLAEPALAGAPGGWRRTMSSRLHEGLGDVLELGAKHEEARTAYERALDAAPEGEGIRRASLFRRTAKTWENLRRYVESLQAHQDAEAALGPEPEPEESAAWWQEWIQNLIDQAQVHYMQVQVEEMAELADRIRPAVA
ncbi:MAG: AAA family ATPase, partial [Chloroflexota bacterium]